MSNPQTTTFSTEELRALADSSLQVFWPSVALHWCADEIERLRAVLSRIEDDPFDCNKVSRLCRGEPE